VLEELTAAGVTIDRIAGVSMGAVIGALFAMGHGADEIDAICFEEWVRRRPLRDFTVPRHSLIRGERFISMLHRTFGSTLIEELPRSFMCGSVELRSGRLEIARYGPLWETVGFSINLPVLAPPQVRGRKLFIDGSLVDNLPVKALADMGEGRSSRSTSRPRRSATKTARKRHPGETTGRPGRPASARRLPGCCCSAARTPLKRPGARPTW
jgi:NTE family protein